MLNIVSDLLILAAASSVGAAQPAPAPAVQAGPRPEADAVKVLDSRTARRVDCGGRDLIVVGDDDTLQVTNCRDIEVAGNRNHIRVKLLEESYISASGNQNNIIYIPVPGIEALTQSTGHGNEINSPPMAIKAPKPSHPPG